MTSSVPHLDASTTCGAEKTGQKVWGTYKARYLASLILALSRRTPLGRGAARKGMFYLFKSCHPGPVDVDLWGSNVRLHPASNFVELKALMRPDCYDVEELRYLSDIMAWTNSCFVDIGANAGLFSLKAALSATGPSKIIAIEPDASLMERLKFNLTSARLLGKVARDVDVEMIEAAISDRNGQGVLSTEGDEGARSLVENSAGRSVNLLTLYDLVTKTALHRIDILKLDVEGHEDKVLPPYFKAAPKALWPAAIIIEHISRKHWQVDCISDAVDRGYAVRFKTNNNTILERKKM